MTRFRSLLFAEVQRIELRQIAMRDTRHPDVEEAEALRVLKRRCVSALLRLNERTYGDCLSCLEPIELERLVETPWEERCAMCAAKVAVAG